MVQEMRSWFYENLGNHATHSFLGGSIAGFFASINVEHSVGVIWHAALGAIISYVISRIMKKLFDEK